jgi:hypothetical protein
MSNSTKALVYNFTGFTGSAIFLVYGILLALGDLRGHASIFSRMGGVALAIFFLLFSVYYGRKLILILKN